MKLCTSFGTRLGMQGCVTFRLVTSAAREKKDSRRSGMFQSCFRMTEIASELVRDIFEFSDLFLFLFIILARNIDQKGILQKTLKQFRLVASK